MWKASWNICLLTMATWLASAGAFEVLRDAATSLGLGVEKEVAALTSPIANTVVAVGNTLCEPLGNLVPDSEPDMSKLTLIFRSPEFTDTYNLNEAADQIPQHPQYNPNHNLIVFAHGFNNDPSGPNFNDTYTALEATGEYNIIALDASFYISRGINYISAATKFVRYIGMALGKVFAALKLAVHCIGHSLGSHICGFAGKTYRNMTGLLIERISAEDPAGPCFANVPEDMKLKQTDAIFVDVIHTDIRFLGLNQNVVRTWYFLSKMGTYNGLYSCPNTTRGVYYLQTGATSPYGLGEDGIHYVNNAGLIRNIQYGLGDLPGL